MTALWAEHAVDAYYRGNNVLVSVVRNNILPAANADDVWTLCDAVRARTSYPSHVPTPATHSVESARDWLDGWFA